MASTSSRRDEGGHVLRNIFLRGLPPKTPPHRAAPKAVAPSFMDRPRRAKPKLAPMPARPLWDDTKTPKPPPEVQARPVPLNLLHGSRMQPIRHLAAQRAKRVQNPFVKFAGIGDPQRACLIKNRHPLCTTEALLHFHGYIRDLADDDSDDAPTPVPPSRQPVRLPPLAATAPPALPSRSPAVATARSPAMTAVATVPGTQPASPEGSPYRGTESSEAYSPVYDDGGTEADEEGAYDEEESDLEAEAEAESEAPSGEGDGEEEDTHNDVGDGAADEAGPAEAEQEPQESEGGGSLCDEPAAAEETPPPAAEDAAEEGPAPADDAPEAEAVPAGGEGEADRMI
eukprot:TRINITY_DN30608_c0_g1_i1.p1 TRINITY_DN30608_c0_g1~~TRINITY_DN30608_c0_g1_i1.p1  ORF type:complete len:342 (+),score=82.90 TRINITY_DN30608_c0_g1_i1:58-1083(+)